jgi:hypothetical protein
MDNYTPEQLDIEVLFWYLSNIKKVSDLPNALHELERNYKPDESNLSFRIAYRLQQLCNLGFGLCIQWRYRGEPEQTGFVYHWGRCENQCIVKQTGKFGCRGVDYSDILSVSLQMP